MATAAAHRSLTNQVPVYSLITPTDPFLKYTHFVPIRNVQREVVESALAAIHESSRPRPSDSGGWPTLDSLDDYLVSVFVPYHDPHMLADFEGDYSTPPGYERRDQINFLWQRTEEEGSSSSLSPYVGYVYTQGDRELQQLEVRHFHLHSDFDHPQHAFDLLHGLIEKARQVGYRTLKVPYNDRYSQTYENIPQYTGVDILFRNAGGIVYDLSGMVPANKVDFEAARNSLLVIHSDLSHWGADIVDLLSNQIDLAKSVPFRVLSPDTTRGAVGGAGGPGVELHSAEDFSDNPNNLFYIFHQKSMNDPEYCPDLPYDGYILAEQGSDEGLHVKYLAVSAPSRRKGLGTQLMLTLISKAREAGYKTMSLHFEADKDHLQNFYKEKIPFLSGVIIRESKIVGTYPEGGPMELIQYSL